MARIYPFRALRYNPSLVRVEDCVTQPYDKITPPMQQAYYARSPYNIVRVILGLPELFDQPGEDDVYTRAARDLHDWREAGILAAEAEPCLFAYSQRFAVPGAETSSGAPETVERRGIIALGELHRYDEGIIFRHEQTLAKPREDRRKLLEATRAHFGQLLMLYSDPARTVERLVFNHATGIASEVPTIEVTDDYNTVHTLWKISDPPTIRMIVGALDDKKLIIGDGHHRYETALAYREANAPPGRSAQQAHERRADALPQPAFPEAAVMMTLINMDEEGLVILPTHRAVHSLAGFSAGAFLEAASAYYTVTPLASTSDPAVLLQSLETATAQSLAVVTAGAAHLLTPIPGAVEQALTHIPERTRTLAVAQLHSLVLEKLLSITPEAIREQRNLRYLRDAGEVVAQVREGEAQIAFLMRAATLGQLREITFAGEVMPQKSTDFYPKLLSGLAVYALD